MNRRKYGISAILYPLIVIVMLMFFISGIFIFIGISKVQERTEKVQHIERIEEAKEDLEIYLYNGTITKDGWKNSNNTNILIVNNGGYDVIIDYFYVFSKNGELLIKGKMNLKIEKGCRENITLNMLGLPNHMNNWKNFEKNVELIAFHTINGNLFISKYEIPTREEVIHH
ncbi:MAG: hypothetical protein QW272_09105 [Candidatus Methanomethylicaceae archaeon]